MSKRVDQIKRVIVDALESVPPSDEMYNGEFLCHLDIPKYGGRNGADVAFTVVARPEEPAYLITITEVPLS